MEVMSEQSKSQKPYKSLGTQLKYIREQSEQSVAEVSGSVEIDDSTLERIEAGVECPSEDILLLLINHFNMRDQDANQLWQLAGYDSPFDEKATSDETNLTKQVVMLLALDTRTVYTDGVDITCNQAGVTLSFTQNSGSGQPPVVARVGMSYDQAENVSRALQTALLQAKFLRSPKGLPPASPSSSSDSEDSTKE